MSTAENTPPRKDVATMRREFDQFFVAPDPLAAAATDDFVAVRVGGQPFALRVSELAWVETRRKIVALPGSRSELLGLVSTRGKFVPVFSLELMLGLPATLGAKSWVAICAGEQQFGLAFEALEGYFRVPRADVLGARGANEDRKEQAVRVAGEVRPVVSVASIQVAIREVASI